MTCIPQITIYLVKVKGIEHKEKQIQGLIIKAMIILTGLSKRHISDEMTLNTEEVKLVAKLFLSGGIYWLVSQSLFILSVSHLVKNSTS